MILTKNELKEYINNDNSHYRKCKRKTRFFFSLVNDPEYEVKKYLKMLRMQEYYINTSHGNRIKSLLSLYYERKKHNIGNKLGFLIGPNSCGKGLTLSHHGTVIINPEAKIGENCTFHGNNCVGNKGVHGTTPRIGNNVDVGFGAVIIGDIDIADNVKIGANAVVNKSIMIPGSTVAGIPGRIIV